MIAQRSPREYLRIVRSQSGRQDSNLRPSAPKALISHSAALGFQAISNFLLSSARFVMTNKVIFVRNLSVKFQLRKICLAFYTRY